MDNIVTKRICELKIGDTFIWCRSLKTVTNITQKKIIFCIVYNARTKREGYNFFGRNSQMLVEVVTEITDEVQVQREAKKKIYAKVYHIPKKSKKARDIDL